MGRFSTGMDTDRTYSLDDLAGWSPPGVALAVLGFPIRHSISPAMHNAALARMAERDAVYSDWHYFRFEVPPEELPRALGLFKKAGFKGLNLTVPHKVLAYDLVNTVGRVKEIGAVNTLVWDSEFWFGYNTDGYGLASGLREDLGVDLAGAHVVLLGAGGAARGAAVECLERGCASLWIANRTRANLDGLLRLLAPLAGEIPVHGFAPEEAAEAAVPAGAVVINATSAGLKPGDPMPIKLGALRGVRAVYDMIYNPAETPLLAAARAAGLPAANGLSMLVHQGARALEIWSGASVPVDAMATAARAAMRR